MGLHGTPLDLCASVNYPQVCGCTPARGIPENAKDMRLTSTLERDDFSPAPMFRVDELDGGKVIGVREGDDDRRRMTGGFYLLLREAQQWLAGTHCTPFSPKTVKPSPLISTVSTPTWMRISAPSSPMMRRRDSWGLRWRSACPRREHRRPPPLARCRSPAHDTTAEHGSGTFSRVITSPATGARTVPAGALTSSASVSRAF